MIEDIRAIVREHARLSIDISKLADDEDLYYAGLTSIGTVSLMLALESKFDLEFPDRMLRRTSFKSIAAIAAAISELLTDQACELS